jgi:hypothetical protein
LVRDESITSTQHNSDTDDKKHEDFLHIAPLNTTLFTTLFLLPLQTNTPFLVYL